MILNLIELGRVSLAILTLMAVALTISAPVRAQDETPAASDSSTSDSSPAPTAAASTDSAPQPAETESSSSSSSSSRSSNDSSWERDTNTNPYEAFDKRMSDQAKARNPRMVFFFPPIPPVMGSQVPAPPLTSRRSRYSAPEELAQYINEPFYAPLATRLWEDILSSRQKRQLEAYRATKLALREELRQRVASLKDADPATRERELAAFAQEQTPRIAELEKLAERLRENLTQGDFLHERVDWSELREWRLGDTKFSTASEAVVAKYLVVRAATFFQKGLSPEQRRLLREIGMDMTSVMGITEGGRNIASPTPLLFFSPETSRIRLPAAISGDLARQIARYENLKASLKKDLMEVITSHDNVFFSAKRTRACEVLAEKQRSAFADLEALAEEIRRGLIKMPNAGAPVPAQMPATLYARWTEYQREKIALNSALSQRLSALLPAALVTPDGSMSATDRIGQVRANRAERDQRVREEIENFRKENAERYEALARSEAFIRNEMAELGRVHAGDTGANLSPDMLIKIFQIALVHAEDWKRLEQDYQEYRTAVLQPGLSPEQRRLLFDSAIEDLDIPLPPGSLQPTNKVE